MAQTGLPVIHTTGRTSAEAPRPDTYHIRVSRIRTLLGRPELLRRAALTSLVGNVGIVLGGGAVRLTGSGLGCPTWPRCVDSSYVTTSAMGYHGVIEFGNRTLTGLVEALAVACLVLALCQLPRLRERVTWAALVFAAIPAQAVLGGLTVLTKLDPWLVASHFLLSIAVIAAAYRLWVVAREPAGPTLPVIGAPLRGLTWLLTGVSAAVLAVGTVVTGSGPHAGDAQARRTGLDPGTVAQLHTDLVMLLIGLSVALWFALRAVDAPAPIRRAAGTLIGVELAQGAIGFVQYATHLPALLVGLHMAGACAVWLATLAILAAGRVRQAAPGAPARRPAPPAEPPVPAGSGSLSA
jgi:cytochrome c oxidase assembly protein subunit 15